MGGEDGHGDTARETYHDGIGNELDDGAEAAGSEKDEEEARQHGGNHETRKAELGIADDAVDNHDERARRTANLYAAAAEGGHEETADDGRKDALRGGNAGGNTESDGQRKGHNADNETCHEVGGKLLLVVVPQLTEEARRKTEIAHSLELLNGFCLFSRTKLKQNVQYSGVSLTNHRCFV